MDSIIYPSISKEEIFAASVFIFFVIAAGYIISVALGKKFNKDLPEKYKPADDVLLHIMFIFWTAFFIFVTACVTFAIMKNNEQVEVQEQRIEYFHDIYGVNLTSSQMRELRYPSQLPERGEEKLYGTTTTWLETESSSGPIEVGLAWVDDEFRLVPIGQQ